MRNVDVEGDECSRFVDAFGVDAAAIGERAGNIETSSSRAGRLEQTELVGDGVLIFANCCSKSASLRWARFCFPAASAAARAASATSAFARAL